MSDLDQLLNEYMELNKIILKLEEITFLNAQKSIFFSHN